MRIWNEEFLGLQVKWKIENTGKFEIENLDWEIFANQSEKFSGESNSDFEGVRYTYAFKALNKGLKLILDYPEGGQKPDSPAFDFNPGVTTIIFSDVQRSEVVEIRWVPKKGKRKTIDLKDFFWRSPISTRKLVPFDFGIVGKKIKKVYQITVRPEQAKFKADLIDLYGSCCISGCDVSEVLDGAHLFPYNGPESCHPKNGILLRKDLHKLMDSHLMAVHPETKKVSLANKVKQEYKEFDGKQVQDPNDSRYTPLIEALDYKWKKFQEYKIRALENYK